MRFATRKEAATMLAEYLTSERGKNPLVLGVPRRAIPMARIIPGAVGGKPDVVRVRKPRAPGQPELAIGAVDQAGIVPKGRCFDIASERDMRGEIRIQQEILRTRRELNPRAQPEIDSASRVVILADDGAATGSSMLAAITSVRARKPRQLLVAMGVAPPETVTRLRSEADAVVCLYSPDAFETVVASLSRRKEEPARARA